MVPRPEIGKNVFHRHRQSRPFAPRKEFVSRSETPTFAGRQLCVSSVEHPFGGLATGELPKATRRPMTLRPSLATGLPLSRMRRPSRRITVARPRVCRKISDKVGFRQPIVALYHGPIAVSQEAAVKRTRTLLPRQLKSSLIMKIVK